MTTKDTSQNKYLNVYIGILFIVAIFIFAIIFKSFTINNYKLLITFGLLCIISETYLIQLPKIGAISVSYAIIFASIILTNPIVSILIALCGIIFRRPYVEGRGYVHILNSPINKTIFNLSQIVIITGISSYIYYYYKYKSSLDISVINIPGGILSILSYIVLNTLFISILTSILLNQKFLYVLKNNYMGFFTNVILVSLLGVIVALAYTEYGIGGIVLFFVPVLLARYSFKLYTDMRKNYFDTINVLIRTVEANDPYTSGHSHRVSIYSEAIARNLGLSEFKIDKIKTAALLHDIGKIGIDKSILNKPGKLDNTEYTTIKMHPSIGAKIITGVDLLKDIEGVIKHHHERYDGKGYPDGLKADEISLETSILTIADTFDAMTSNRSYRDALPLDYALGELRRCAGTQFNPNIINKSIEALTTAYEQIKLEDN